MPSVRAWGGYGGWVVKACDARWATAVPALAAEAVCAADRFRLGCLDGMGDALRFSEVRLGSDLMVSDGGFVDNW